jgi:hypothetical protein
MNCAAPVTFLPAAPKDNFVAVTDNVFPICAPPKPMRIAAPNKAIVDGVAPIIAVSTLAQEPLHVLLGQV